MPPRALGLLVLALVVPAFAGCTSRAGEGAPAAPDVVEALADTRAMDWSKGNWWAYHASIENKSFDVALIVHDARADSFRVGTNLSTGFFGLPWSGNVTGDLNPRIGGDEWKLYDFPLEDGKTWSYKMLGHDATTLARATTYHVPGIGLRPGFRLESSSYGHVFARYNYVPEVGWFTRLQLIEPTDGHTVLDAQLTAFGTDWQAAYYVEETIQDVHVDFPAAPGSAYVTIPDGYLQVRATLIAESQAGLVDAQLKDVHGRLLANARVLAKGADAERASARMRGATTWTLETAGVGTGSVHLEITGLSATGPLAGASPPPTYDDVDLSRFFVQSTRPAYPQEGHVTSTAPPLAPGV
ncbi:MAG TPA: hypothetical protein VM370_06815 [Candidatus Thermoplasmatota archaeon]|nr:hypothetical protein [Candidatus Thermoplasmatota archaeon]